MFAKLNLLFFLDTISGFHFTRNSRAEILLPLDFRPKPDKSELRLFNGHSIVCQSLA